MDFRAIVEYWIKPQLKIFNLALGLTNLFTINHSWLEAILKLQTSYLNESTINNIFWASVLALFCFMRFTSLYQLINPSFEVSTFFALGNIFTTGTFPLINFLIDLDGGDWAGLGGAIIATGFLYPIGKFFLLLALITSIFLIFYYFLNRKDR
jgi:hypothetical protein